MTVKDIYSDETSSRPMAKRQKTDSSESHAKDVQPKGDSEDVRLSYEMLGVLSVATSNAPDMNTVDFSDDISDIEITPGPEPLSDSDIPPRPPKHKKKKHKKAEKSKKLPVDDDKSQKKDGQNGSTRADAQAT